jgi:folate-dependent phosphoribosylglycinamide formyltransferase PurN
VSPETPAPDSEARPFRLGVLLSGRGSNFLAIARSIREGRLQGIEIAVVISNVADAPGLAAAHELVPAPTTMRMYSPACAGTM